MNATLYAASDFALPGDVPSARTAATAAITKAAAASASFLLVNVLLSFRMTRGSRGARRRYPTPGRVARTPICEFGGLPGARIVVRGKDAGSPDSGCYRDDRGRRGERQIG